MDVSDDSTFGFRFFDNINANAKGRFLFDNFGSLTNRNNLALPYEWNRMTYLRQWQISRGTTMITGRVGPQFAYGSQYVGGATQWYILNLSSLI